MKDPEQIANKVQEEMAAISTTDTLQGNPINFPELVSVVEKWLLLKDKGVLRVLAATVLANKLQGDPVWLFLVCASGGSKTELLRGLNLIPHIYPLSDLTPQTFLSGQKGEDASLLHRIDAYKTIMVMKDFTTVLSMHHDKSQAILSQLREIYDGYIEKPFGTGETKKWKGKMGFIAGVTTIIDRYQTVHQMLGARFIQYHLVHEDALILARKAIENTGDEAKMRREIQEAFARFILGVEIPESNPDVSDEVHERIAHLATLCVLARSGVIREGRSSRDIEFIPDPEVPTRLAKELLQLATGLALLDESTDEENYELVFKVGIDSIPQVRRRILLMMRLDEEYETGKVAKTVGYPLSSTRRALEEISALGLVKQRKGGDGLADWWALSAYAAELLKTALPDSKREEHTSPETSGDAFDEVNRLFDEAEQATLPEVSGGTNNKTDNVG